MAKTKLKVRRIYSSEGTILEKKYFLSQALTAFSGILILLPIIEQNIKNDGYTLDNILTIVVTAILGLLSLTFCYSAGLSKPVQVSAFIRMVIKSNWGGIALLFFYFIWITTSTKFIVSKMNNWLIVPSLIVGVLLILVSAWIALFARSSVKEANMNKQTAR